MRKDTQLCAKKMNYKLKKEGLVISDRVIGKIIKTEGSVRKYRIRKLKYKYIKAPLAIGDLVEIDIKYVPSKIRGKRYYQYTAIDCASHWRYLKIYDDMGNGSSIKFLKEVIKVAKFRIRAIKTDNGSCFTNRYTGYQLSPHYSLIREIDVEKYFQLKTDERKVKERFNFTIFPLLHNILTISEKTALQNLNQIFLGNLKTIPNKILNS